MTLHLYQDFSLLYAEFGVYDKLRGSFVRSLMNGSHCIQTYIPEHGLFSKVQSERDVAVDGQLI